VFDIEGGVRFTPSDKVAWDPRLEPPSNDDGSLETVVVTTTDLDDIRRAYDWLTTGKHPFKSVVIDSLTEVQKRMIDELAGTQQLTMQNFGELYRRVDALVRSYRDLTMNPQHPLDVVVFVTGSREKGQEHPVVRPALQGSEAEQIGYNVDVMTYLAVSTNAEGDIERRAQFIQLDGIAAKDRTGKLGSQIVNPTIPNMLEAIYGPEEGV